MTAKDLVIERAPNWSEEQAAAALRAAESESGLIVVEDTRPVEPSSDIDEELGEPEMVGLPEYLKTFEDGTPVPNWVAGLDEVRNGR